MSQAPCWSRIPYEISLKIFENAIEDVEYHAKKQDLSNFQRVCKSWSKGAQKLLYADIILDRPHHKQFVDTMRQRGPSIGALVKKLQFEDTFDEGIELVFDAFEENCANLEEIYAVDDGQKPELYNQLMFSTKIKKLKVIDKNLKNQKVYPTYPFAAFKYRETLTDIFVDYDHQPGVYYSKEILMEQLSHFKSLQRVMISLYLDTHRIEEVINNSPNTVHTLILQNSQQNGGFEGPDYDKCEPKRSIKKLMITETVRLGAGHLTYLKFKLDALESLSVAATKLYPDLDEQYLDFFTSAPNYNVSIALEDNEDLLNRMDYFLQRSVIDGETQKRKEFEVDFDYMPSTKYEQYEVRPTIFSDWHLDLARDSNLKSAKMRYVKDNSGDEPVGRYIFISDIAVWMQRYSPTIVRLYNIEPMVDHYIHLLENNNLPQYSTVASVRRYFAWIGQDRSWQLLDNAISCFSAKKGSILSFGEMIFCDEPNLPQFAETKATCISRVEIRKSIIYYKLLPILSNKLKRIDTLMIDSSWIVMDDDVNTLKIFLPFTQLRRIGIVISPFDYQPVREDISEDGMENQHPQTILDNPNLLEATSENGKYILKIETPDGTFMSYRQGNKNIGNIKDMDMTQGTEDNFMIWIKCEFVEQFVIVGGISENVNWNPNFEHVSAMK